MLGELYHLDDCAGVHYRLQLNCYRYILQKYYGATVVGMYVVGTHPDNGDQAFVDDVPIMDAEVQVLMKAQRMRKHEVEALCQHDLWTTDPLGGEDGSDQDDENTVGGAGSTTPPDSQRVRPCPPSPAHQGRRLRRKTSEPSVLLSQGESQSSQPRAGGQSHSPAYAARSSRAPVSSPRATPAPALGSQEQSLEELLETHLFGTAAGDALETSPAAPQPRCDGRSMASQPTPDFESALEMEQEWLHYQDEAMQPSRDGPFAPPTPSTPLGVPSAPPTQHGSQSSVKDEDMFVPGQVAGSSAAGEAPVQPHAHNPSSLDMDLDELFGHGERLAVDMADDVDVEACDIIAQTNKAAELVDRHCPPDWPADLKQIAVGALSVYRYRLIDITMREHAHLLYIVEGHQRLRAHRGTCFVYKDGAFTPFTGVAPQGLLGRVKEFILRLEGLFRSIDVETDRNDEALLIAVNKAVLAYGGRALCLARWESVSISHSGPPRMRRSASVAGLDGEQGAHRGEGDAKADESLPWPRVVAYALSRVSASLQKEILSRNLIPYFTEWCETPSPARPGFALKNKSFLFDVDSRCMKEVRKSHVNNIYVYLPHELALGTIVDPVLLDAFARVKKFMTTTFWNNREAYMAQLAAQGLCLRGRNVDRSFWTKGPGGVGQSLNSHHIAALFGENHAFLDMNIYYSDDELRTCGNLSPASSG